MSELEYTLDSNLNPLEQMEEIHVDQLVETILYNQSLFPVFSILD